MPPRAPRGDIEFRNVWFAYNNENWVLRDVSFQVKSWGVGCDRRAYRSRKDHDDESAHAVL